MYAPLADAGGVLPLELPDVDALPFPLLDELTPEPELDELAELLVEPMPLAPLEAPELDVLEPILELRPVETLELWLDNGPVLTVEAPTSLP